MQNAAIGIPDRKRPSIRNRRPPRRWRRRWLPRSASRSRHNWPAIGPAKSAAGNRRKRAVQPRQADGCTVDRRAGRQNRRRPAKPFVPTTGPTENDRGKLSVVAAMHRCWTCPIPGKNESGPVLSNRSFSLPGLATDCFGWPTPPVQNPLVCFAPSPFLAQPHGRRDCFKIRCTLHPGGSQGTSGEGTVAV